MKVKLISVNVAIGHTNEITTPDRRFKKGYRVLTPEHTGYQLKFRLSNPDGRFRTHENIITEYGYFRVVSIDNSIGCMDIMQCKMIEIGNNLNFNAEIDIRSGGFTAGEGSVTPQKA